MKREGWKRVKPSKDKHTGEETGRILKGAKGRERRSGAWSQVDEQLLSVRLTQREQGSAICSKVNGKETRWGGDAGPSLRGGSSAAARGDQGRGRSLGEKT